MMGGGRRLAYKEVVWVLDVDLVKSGCMRWWIGYMEVKWRPLIAKIRSRLESQTKMIEGFLQEEQYKKKR